MNFKMKMRKVSFRRGIIPSIKLFLLIAACWLPPVPFAQAVTINVPADQATIQGAINMATPGDIVVVAPGSYMETIDFLGKAITLRSSGGPLVTIIDGSGSIGSVVQCVSGEGADTVLEGFTITGGNADVGGGMLNRGSSPTIIDCIFTDNHAVDRGGGMYNREGSPTVIASTFDGNTAGAMGGGMFNIRATPTVTECLFTQNSSEKGGGMRNYLNSHAIVTDSIFSYNHAESEGGGMDNRKNSNAVVTGCIFAGNTAGSGGGGMHNYVGRAVATGNPLIINCLFIGNSSPTGAGIRNNDPDPTINTTTIAYNYGSGISSRNGSAPIIENSIVWGNSGGSFSGASSGSSIVTYSDIEGGFPGIGNLDVDPLFVSPAGPDGNLATLGDNDYHLSAGSPLINVGINDPALPATDLDGNSRITGGTVDMGAYEFDDSCSVGEGSDNDGDSYTTCGGDCNDNDADIHPSAAELCDGIDNNCSGSADEGFDIDGDGYTTCGGDCDDSDASIHPSAAEVCTDGLDNDCDMSIDDVDSECSIGGGDGIHVGDLDYESSKLPKGNWMTVITIMVHTPDHSPVADATVTGTFHQGSSTSESMQCITDGAGSCLIDSGPLLKKGGSAVFTVDSLSHATLDPDLSQSHDPDGDSDGNSINVSK